MIQSHSEQWDWRNTDRTHLRKWQNERLRALLRELAANPFYQEKFAAAGLAMADMREVSDLDKLPFTTKGELGRTACPSALWPLADLSAGAISLFTSDLWHDGTFAQMVGYGGGLGSLHALLGRGLSRRRRDSRRSGLSGFFLWPLCESLDGH